jgi:hypothetical protein
MFAARGNIKPSRVPGEEVIARPNRFALAKVIFSKPL